MRSNSQSCAGGAESGQVGDDLSNVDGSGSNSGVEGCSRGRGGEGSDGGDGELHFDGVGGCWWLMVYAHRRESSSAVTCIAVKARAERTHFSLFSTK